MRVLIACEFSGIVRDAFIRKGHDAVSCDLLATESKGPHIQGNVLDHLNDGWDLMIAHPPCTYLSSVAAPHLFPKGELNMARFEEGLKAREFFMALYDSDIERVCVENPVPFKIFNLPDYSQIVHPYYFGEPHMKRTCLWLKNLPLLTYTKGEKPEPYYRLKTNGERIYHTVATSGSKKRSVFWTGIANAMAEQWGGE